MDRSIPATIAITAALVLAAVAVTRPASAPPAASGTPSITASGSATIHVAPDIAVMTISVSATADTVDAARDQTASRIDAVLAALRAAGVEDSDVVARNIGLYPVYPPACVETWSPGAAGGSGGGMPAPTVMPCDPVAASTPAGYTMSEDLEVTVRSIDTTGAVVSAATGAGATGIGSLRFDVADRSGAMNRARELAVAEAKATAKAMTSSAGVSTGALLSLVDSFSGGGPMWASGDVKSAAPEFAVPAGTLDITATVTLSYAISQ